MIYVRRSVKDLLFAFGVACLSLVATADSLVEPAVDRLAPDFIRTSLIVCGPGDMLYSCAGHAALRLTCPHFGLDEVFSYEGEPVRDQFLRFFAGRLKMGMFATPMAEFLQEYHSEGRSVCEYPLELPPAAEVRLWKILDQRVAEGPYLPYDYVRRGCAQAMLQCLLAAVKGEQVEAELPKRFGQTRRDAVHAALVDHPWTALLLDLVAGPEGDRMRTATDVIVLPEDLVDYLRGVRVDGVAVLKGGPVEQVAQVVEAKGIGSIVTPNACAFAVLALTALAWFLRWRRVLGLLLAVDLCFSLFMTYLGVFSSLPVATWNVLLIPFNPLPFVCWRWRARWGNGYAALLVAWSLWVFLAPHQPTNPAFAVLALALALACQRVWRRA